MEEKCGQEENILGRTVKPVTVNRAQVLCGDVLRNESLKPSHLERNPTTEHAVLKEKAIYFSCWIEAVQTGLKTTIQ